MSDPAQAERSAAAAAGSFVGTFALVLAAIAVLWVVDTILVEKEQAERRSEAHQLYQEGLRLQSQGAMQDAVDRLRSAFSDERDNPVYQRALAAAQLAAGKIPDAQIVLTDRLQRDPTDAAASLIMARTLVQQHQLTQAIAFYHRAIYGQWEEDRVASQNRARFELADLLAREGLRQELLAELLPLRTEAPGDAQTRKRIARLFIAAGSPSQAVGILREILRQNADDAEAWGDLGEAEFQRANYRAARTAFLTALKLTPENRGMTARLALSDQVLALDPAERGIGSAEQYRRSLNLLRLTLGAATGCTGTPSSQSLQALTDSARKAVGQRVPESRFHDAAEANLDLAARYWQARQKECTRTVPESETALSLVLEKAAE